MDFFLGFFLDGVLLTGVTGPAFPLEQVAITVQTVVTPAEVEVAGGEALLAEADVRIVGAAVFDILLGGLELQGPGGAHRREGGEHPPEALIAAGDVVGIHVGIAQKRETSSTAGGHFFEDFFFLKNKTIFVKNQEKKITEERKNFFLHERKKN